MISWVAARRNRSLEASAPPVDSALIFGKGSGAHAAPVVVKVSDIDTSSAHGAKILNQRIDVAAREFCGRTQPGAMARLADNACIRGVRTEITEGVANRNAMMAKARGAELAQR